MKRKGITQEALKLIACITMLLDHIGAVFLSGMALRIVGRIAFPIYCFLLAEGVRYTRDPKRYALRLGIGALLAEIPFDLLFYGELTLEHQSVMVTLLLGLAMVVCMKRFSDWSAKILVVVPFALLAELLRTDYGGWGIALIAVFALTREHPQRLWLQTGCCAVIYYMIGGLRIYGFPIQMFALLAMLPLALYSGEKRTSSPWLHRTFYLFYPGHLAVLLLLRG